MDSIMFRHKDYVFCSLGCNSRNVVIEGFGTRGHDADGLVCWFSRGGYILVPFLQLILQYVPKEEEKEEDANGLVNPPTEKLNI